MTAQNKEARTVGAVPSPKEDGNRPKTYSPQAQPRQYPEGCSRWVEPKTVWDVDEFLELWGTSIVALRQDVEVDEEELRQEADAWGRALHARKAVR